MNHYFTLIIAAVLLCTVFADPYLNIDLQQKYISIVKDTTSIKNVVPIYNAIVLSKSLEVRMGEVNCKSVKFDISTPKLAYYSQVVSDTLKCDSFKLPKTLNTKSFEDKYFAIQLKTVSGSTISEAVKASFELLNECVTESGCASSFNSIAYAYKIIAHEYNTLTKEQQDKFSGYYNNVAMVFKTQLVDTKKWSLTEVTGIVEACYDVYKIEHKQFPTEAVTFLASLLEKTMETQKLFIASQTSRIYTLLTRMNTDVIYFDIVEDEKVTMIKPVNLMGKTSNDDIEITSPDTVFDVTHRKGIYFLYTASLPSGTHTFNLNCSKRSQTYIYVNQPSLHIENYSIFTEDEDTPVTMTLPYTESEQIYQYTDGIQTTIKVSLANNAGTSVTPVFVVAEVHNNEHPELYTQIVLKLVDNEYTGSFNILMESFIHDLDYTNGLYDVYIRVGDLNYAPYYVKIYQFNIKYPAIDRHPHYSLYSKSLTYESDTTLVPLPEIRHSFNTETKQPSLLLSCGFSLLVISSLVLCILIILKLFKEQLNNHSFTTIVKNLLFISCLTLIAIFYFKFWLNWTMFDLMHKLIPVIIITLILGNRALHN